MQDKGFQNRAAAKDVGVEARTGNVLSDLLADDHIRLGQHDAGHIGLGLLDQLLLLLDPALGGDGLDAAGLVIGVFQNGHAKADGGLLQDDPGGLLQHGGKVV